MMNIFIGIFLFVVLNSLSFEFLINKGDSTVELIVAIVIFFASLFIFVIKPIRNRK